MRETNYNMAQKYWLIKVAFTDIRVMEKVRPASFLIQRSRLFSFFFLLLSVSLHDPLLIIVHCVTGIIFICHYRLYLSLLQTMSSPFISMSFITHLDYSVVHVGVVDNQPAVMMCNGETTVKTYNHAPVIRGFGSY